MFLDGELAAERWVNAARTSVAEAVERLQARGALGGEDGGRWLVEVYDPAAPAGRAYVRITAAEPVAAITAAEALPCDAALLRR